MIDFQTILPAKRKLTPSGWWSFNAVCCHHNGERHDTKTRGGMMIHSDGSFNYKCLNCGFTTAFKWGGRLSFNTRKLLIWFGVDEHTIDVIQLESIRQRTLGGLLQDDVDVKPRFVRFEERSLPSGLQVLSYDNPEHHRFYEYLMGRGIDPSKYVYMVSPDAPGRDRNRIVIPFTYKNKIVGHSARYLDDLPRKYISSTQHGYVFNTDAQPNHWSRVLVVEGVFDALVIGGVAVLHNEVNADQISVISRLNREVVVVPDRDEAGLKLVDHAIELGWSVSLPEWDAGIKDVSDAVKRYGRLPTLITIMDHTESNPLKIQIKRRALAHRVFG